MRDPVSTPPAAHALAGQPAPKDLLIDVAGLQHAYYTHVPDLEDPSQRVRFRATGHHGSSLRGSFTDAHVAAITQAICDYRRGRSSTGPLFLARDTHALSGLALMTALEVLAGNGVETIIDAGGGCAPAPAVSHAILSYNRGRTTHRADAIILAPAGRLPEDGGLKYDAPSAGPADAGVAGWIETRANELLSSPAGLRRLGPRKARRATTTHTGDFVGAYMDDLAAVVDFALMRHVRLKIGVDPLGGASLALWQPIADRYGVDIEIVNHARNATFGFMPIDRDGVIRMDCTSPYAMARLLRVKDQFDIAFGIDPDSGRHGIVTRRAGLLPAHHYLAVAIDYLFTYRLTWRPDAAVGKTVVSSGLLDRIAAKVGRGVVDMPVGFAWFVPGLLEGSLGFAADECAGATFLRRDGTPWTTDRDGIVMGLLAIELMARTGRDPAERYAELLRDLGEPVYATADAPATAGERTMLRRLAADDVHASTLAGDPIETLVTNAPGNGAPLGGLKIATAHGWVLVRPSRSRPLWKLYAESFRGPDHLKQLQEEGLAIVRQALADVIAQRAHQRR